MLRHLTLLIAVSLLILISCEESQKTVPTNSELVQMELLDAGQTGVQFENKVREEVNRNLGYYDYFYNGSGCAVGDFNNDGKPDLFFAGNDTDNHLYFNKGDLKFVEAAEKAGVQSKDRWSTGVTLVDINEDGWLDIYVCNSGPTNDKEKLTNQLYINKGHSYTLDGGIQGVSFEEKAAEYQVDDASRSTQAAFFDIDKDGDLDLFVMNHSLRNRASGIEQWYEKTQALPEERKKRDSNTFFRNNGNGRFEEYSAPAGLDKIGFGLGLAVTDFDENGFLDIYVANDYFIPDFMFMNNGDQTFTEKIKKKAPHISYYSMGCDAADFNNDGLVDLAVVDMTPGDHVRNKTLMSSMNPLQFSYLTENKKYASQYMFNSLQLNRGYGLMSEIGLMAGVAQTDWSWAALLADFNNDGFKDFMVSNGYLRDTKDNDWRIALRKRKKEEGDTPEVYFDHLKKAKSYPVPNYIFQNNGAQNGGLIFSDKTEEWGFKRPSFSNGAAYADLDQDGDLDLIVNNLEAKAFVYKNNSREKTGDHYIQFKLTDKDKPSSVWNAKVTIHYDGQLQTQEYYFTRGFQSYMEPLIHFGLGKTEGINKVEIKWLDGTLSTINNPELNKTHLIERSSIQSVPISQKEDKPVFADVITQQKEITFKHKENEYNDFAVEVLLPHRQSQLGPALAVGDFNADGLDDFYVGGASGQSGELYWQDEGGIFHPVEQNIFRNDGASEDLGALFFDADSDGDLDLYVCSGGGGDFSNKKRLLQDRLYLNQGKGKFSKAENWLPEMQSSTKAVSAADWDQDGDLDLFVGGRTSPGKYPTTPESFLLRNDGDKFTNVISEVAPSLAFCGMVTAASWSDINQDGRTDLMVVGEWMAPMIFQNTESGFVDLSAESSLADYRGWWYSLAQKDMDGDGDVDFILGNLGHNNKFHPSREKEFHVYANDYDENGTPDIVLSKNYKGNLVPVRGKECSTEQMPFLAEKFPTYSEFANSSLIDIYGENKIAESLHFAVNDFTSIYVENQGDFKFTVHALPIEAQLGPIQGIVIEDFDKDGIKDLLIAGGMMETEVETPSYDANYGLLLKGTGAGGFNPMLHVNESGIFLSQNVKMIQQINLGKGKRPAILVGNNNKALQMLVYTL